MADIDVSAQGLAVPPASAPKTIYVPAISVKNNGIVARVASGTLSVYDKVAGTLIETWNVTSEELEPGQTANATADGTFDIEDEEVGKQFLFSGIVSCDGDQVPQNDPLNPVTVTVSGDDPPPPPTVPSHRTQHQDGGSDELSVDGLFGVLAQGQPIQEHHATHEPGGDDELSILGLSGLAADRQTPLVHDNDEHSEDFATETEVGTAITVHNAGIDRHEAAENLEKTANKGVADGYLGLDGGAVAIPLQLGFKTGPDIVACQLQGNKIWIQPIGGCISLNRLSVTPGAGEVTLGTLLASQYWIEGALGELCHDCRIYGRVDGLTPGDTVTFRLYLWPTAGGATPALHTIVWTAGATDNDVVFRCNLRAMWDPTNNNIVGQGDLVGLDTGGGPNAESHAMPTETLTAWWNPHQDTTAYATVQVTGAAPLGHNFNSNLVTSRLMEYLT
jgi:hypothetical protein